MKKSTKDNISKTVVYYKLITGIIELILGLGILFLGKNISRIYASYKLKELLEDPHDLLINIVGEITPILRHYHTYLMVFLIVFGVVKIIGAIGLLYDKEWGLDLLIMFFFLMLPFDIYTLLSHITFLKTLYFLINTLIAFYLVEFRPHTYFWKYINILKKMRK
jgi:uncharacterized membrane protein (DUF2068 family)